MGNNRPDAERLGEINYNTFGSEMKIIRYNGSKDIDIYFVEYDYIAKNKQYRDFKNGVIKCPYEPRTVGMGYMGEGKYKSKLNGKKTKAYETWRNMLGRCYDPKLHEKYPTYKDCQVCEEWLNFQNFAEWYEENYYEVGNKTMCLDKDILYKGNKLYSPKTCIFVPDRINKLFVKNDDSRGDLPIGVGKYFNKYYVSKKNQNERAKLYNTIEETFIVYKKLKEEEIKEVANEYKEFIPQKLYDAMYRYEVEIND